MLLQATTQHTLLLSLCNKAILLFSVCFSMVSERFSGSSSSLSSSTSESTPERLCGGSDRMVEKELEAAEALADLAHFGIRETPCGNWGLKGRRAGKRVKSEFPSCDLSLNLADSVSQTLHLANEDKAIVSNQPTEKVCRRVLAESPNTRQDSQKNDLKVEQDPELPNKSVLHASSYSSLRCGNSRRNLTEEEKEARRIRRVLANRESARQTIRRRQALCEELTRKAADLAWENENLKKEMELAMKDFQLLETTNKHLKDQMAKVIKAEAGENLNCHKPACAQISSALPANCSLFLYNHLPYKTVFWPSVSQSPNAIQAQVPQNATMMQADVALPASRPDSSWEQDNPMNVNGSRGPVYIVPCPLFFPHPNHVNGPQSQPAVLPKNETEEASSSNHQCSASSSSRTAAENQLSLLPIKVKTEASGFITRDLNEIPTGSAEDEGELCAGSHSKEKAVEQTFKPVKCVSPGSTIKHENRFQLHCTPHITSPNICHSFGVMPDINFESIIYQNKKVANAIAAAEARKRRKTLTKLKNIHGRQCQMQF